MYVPNVPPCRCHIESHLCLLSFRRRGRRPLAQMAEPQRQPRHAQPADERGQRRAKHRSHRQTHRVAAAGCRLERLQHGGAQPVPTFHRAGRGGHGGQHGKQPYLGAHLGLHEKSRRSASSFGIRSDRSNMLFVATRAHGSERDANGRAQRGSTRHGWFIPPSSYGWKHNILHSKCRHSRPEPIRPLVLILILAIRPQCQPLQPHQRPVGCRRLEDGLLRMTRRALDY
jgi:hypothetical protein